MSNGIEALVCASAVRKAVPEKSPRRRAPIVCSTLRLADLKSRTYTMSRLMNVKIPAGLALGAVAQHIHASKTEVVIALLNVGLRSPIKARFPEVVS